MLFPQPPLCRPFLTHRPGTSLWLFQYNIGIKLYPTCVEFFEDPFLGGKAVARFVLDIDGPISDWTAAVDMPQSKIEVSGRDSNGDFFRYIIGLGGSGIEITPKKGKPKQGAIFFECPRPYNDPLPCQNGERLDLGGYKKLVWEERVDALNARDPESFREILQVLYEWIPPQTPKSDIIQSDTLLGEFLRSIESEGEWLSHFVAICECALTGMFVFQKEDNRFLGYKKPVFPPHMTTRDVLTALSYGIRRAITFLSGDSKEAVVHLSTGITRVFPSGRVWNMNLFGHAISYEWRKKKARRLMMRTITDELTVKVCCQQPVIEFSLREGRLSAKKIKSSFDKPLHLKPEMKYLCDNFFFASSSSEVIA